MSDENKKYNPTLCGLYQMANGYWSLPINTKDYDSFMNHVEQGGRVVVKVPKTRNNPKHPHAYLEIIPAAKVKEMDEEFAKKNPKKASSEEI